jgi:hypothetical protein
MFFVATHCNNASSEYFGDHLLGFARTVDAMVGEFIGRQALRVERTETRFIAKKRTPRHGHASSKKNVDGRIEPEHWDARSPKKIWTARLGIRTATESEDGAFFKFRTAAQHGAKLVGFNLTESRLAKPFEDLRDRQARGFFDAVIEIDKPPSELPGEQTTDGGFAGAHETSKAQNLNAGLGPSRRRSGCHAIQSAKESNRASECELYHCRKRVRLSQGPPRRYRTGLW